MEPAWHWHCCTLVQPLRLWLWHVDRDSSWAAPKTCLVTSEVHQGSQQKQSSRRLRCKDDEFSNLLLQSDAIGKHIVVDYTWIFRTIPCALCTFANDGTLVSWQNLSCVVWITPLMDQWPIYLFLHGPCSWELVSVCAPFCQALAVQFRAKNCCWEPKFTTPFTYKQMHVDNLGCQFWFHSIKTSTVLSSWICTYRINENYRCLEQSLQLQVHLVKLPTCTLAM